MKKVLFVCHRNVVRSQMAEGFYNKFAKKGKATSAGTHSRLANFVFKHRAARTAIEVMKDVNVDISKHGVTQLTEDMVKNADEVYVLCPKMDCPKYLLNSKKATFWKIKDPLLYGIDFTKKIRDKIKKKVLNIV